MSNKKKFFIMFVLVISMLVTIAPGGTLPGGCTPGYWKNHYPNELSSETVGNIFGNAPTQLAGDTLLQALKYKGGSGDIGAARILLRAATASLANSVMLDFPLEYGQVVSLTNAAFGQGRSSMLSLASYFDNLNNAGCPLN